MKYKISPPQRRRLRLNKRNSVILKSDAGAVLEVSDADQLIEGDYSGMVTCGFLTEAPSVRRAPVPVVAPVAPVAPEPEPEPGIENIFPKPPVKDNTEAPCDEMAKALAALKSDSVTIEEARTPSNASEEPVKAPAPDAISTTPKRRRLATKAPEPVDEVNESAPEPPKKKVSPKKRRTRKKTT